MAFLFTKDLEVREESFKRNLKHDGLPKNFPFLLFKAKNVCFNGEIKITKKKISIFFLQEGYLKALRNNFSRKTLGNLYFFKFNFLKSNKTVLKTKENRKIFGKIFFLRQLNKILFTFLWNNRKRVKKKNLKKIIPGFPEKYFNLVDDFHFSVLNSLVYCLFFFKNFFLDARLKKIKKLSRIFIEKRRFFLRLFFQMF